MRQLVRKDNEAYAIQRNMRVSPSKANAVLEVRAELPQVMVQVSP